MFYLWLLQGTAPDLSCIYEPQIL